MNLNETTLISVDVHFLIELNEARDTVSFVLMTKTIFYCLMNIKRSKCSLNDCLAFETQTREPILFFIYLILFVVVVLQT